MKLKAVEVMQILLVVEAIKQGSLDGNKVADEMVSQFVDRYVEGEPEALEAIKEVVKDIDGGFLGGIINKGLKKFAVAKPEVAVEKTEPKIVVDDDAPAEPE